MVSICNGFSCRSKSMVDPILAVTDPTRVMQDTHGQNMCVCVNLASTMLSLCHDGVSTHRPVLSVPLGAAINKD